MLESAPSRWGMVEEACFEKKTNLWLVNASRGAQRLGDGYGATSAKQSIISPSKAIMPQL
ncbi:MAG: hypothetical protein AYK23_00435 [Candidatus Proteinoplasmatales archaeon SG8-5]|nr:MAG: hypothetical protein AYK23_00435 [Candidatus Proteinoplasmatales archaeon SG8-5]